MSGVSSLWGAVSQCAQLLPAVGTQHAGGRGDGGGSYEVITGGDGWGTLPYLHVVCMQSHTGQDSTSLTTYHTNTNADTVFSGECREGHTLNTDIQKPGIEYY